MNSARQDSCNTAGTERATADTTGSKIPSCPDCFKEFKSIKTYYCHLKKCDSQSVLPKERKEYACGQCKMICTTKIGLQRHHDSVHAGNKNSNEEEPKQEIGALKVFQDSSALLRPKAEETTVDIYVCLECGKVCSGQTGYYRHRSNDCTLSEESPNVSRKFCESCEEMFEFKTAYKRHVKICGLGLEHEIALVNKSRKCHYFKCDYNQSNIMNAGKEMRLFSIPYHSQRAFLERMNIASLAPNIPLFASLRICSNHFPDSAFDGRYRFKKLLRGSLPFDWRDGYSKEEVQEIETSIGYKSGQDILEFIKSLRAEKRQVELNENDSNEKINECGLELVQSDFTAVIDMNSGEDDGFVNSSVPPKEKLCRLCGEAKEELIGIFDQAGLDMGIPTKIAKVLPVHVHKNDCLPHQVCIQCAGGVDFIYQMFARVVESEKLLNEIYNPPQVISTIDVPKVVFLDAENSNTEADLLGGELNLKAHSFAFENSKNALNEVAYSPLLCTLCDCVFDNADEYVDHHRIFHRRHLIVCTLCQTFYDNIASLREHWYQIHTQNLQNKAIQLGNGETVTLRRRRDKYECKYCRKTFNERHVYRAHLADEQKKIKAGKPATLRCNYCPEMFVDAMKRTWHMLRTHKEYTPYQCSMCDRKFRLKHSKNIHERAHQREALQDNHLCNVCGKMLSSKMMLRQHMRLHMDPLACRVCGKMMVPDRLRVHMRRHKDHRPYFCRKCGASFQFAHKLKHHMNLHADRKFSCEKCPFKASLKTILNTHMQELHGTDFSSIVKCFFEDCRAVFETNRELYEHSCKEHSTTGYIQRSILEGTDGFFCRYCEMRFESPNIYSSHIRKVHAEVKEPVYSCSVCKLETTQLVDLGIHLETHPECCRFQCQQCTLKFSTSRRRGSHEFGTHFRKKKICPKCGKGVDNLKDHMNIHKGLRPYKCPMCDLDFARITNWKVHLAIHLDHRPHKCNYCDSAFRTRVELKRHTNLHTAENIFECKSCSYACTSKQSMRMHNQKQHVQGSQAAKVIDREEATDQLLEEQIIEERVFQHQVDNDSNQVGYFVVQLDDID